MMMYYYYCQDPNYAWLSYLLLQFNGKALAGSDRWMVRKIEAEAEVEEE